MNEQEEFEFRLRLEKEQAAASKKPATKTEPTTAEKVAANPFTRFAIAAAEPWQGITQRVSEMDPGINPIVMQAKLAAQYWRPTLDESFAATKDMAKAGGHEGYDLAGIAGNVMSPVSLATMKLPIPKPLIGKTVLGVGTGAGGGALAPADTPDAAEQNMRFGATVAGLFPPALVGIAKASEAVANKIGRPIADLFTKAGWQRIANKEVLKAVGEEDIPAVVNAARQANAPKVGPGLYDVENFKPTMAQSTVGLDEASPVAALQKMIAQTKGGISSSFGKRFTQQQNALDAAKDAADKAAAPMRDTALENANIGGKYLPALLEDIKKKFASRGSALQTKGKLNTFAAQQETAANKWTPVPGMPRFPGRYAPHMENVAPAKAGADVAGDVATQRASEEAFKKFQADSLARHGYFPLTTESIDKQLTSLMNKPGNKLNPTAQEALGKIRDMLRGAVDENGIIDARELYTLRKFGAANVIEKYAKDNASWDKQMTAGLLTNVKSAIDDAIEKSGGTGWKNYLREYSDRMSSIEGLIERSKAMYSPKQTTNVGGLEAMGEDARPKIGNVLSRPVMIANWILRSASRSGESGIDKAMANMMLNPGKFADEMSKTPPMTTVDIEKWLRRSNALTAGAASAQ